MEAEKDALAERLVSVRVVEQKAVVQVENSQTKSNELATTLDQERQMR